jgi:hypothetical protein
MMRPLLNSEPFAIDDASVPLLFDKIESGGNIFTSSELDELYLSPFFSEDVFEVIDCSTSEYLPATIGKSRIRRFDDVSELCEILITTPPPSTDADDTLSGSAEPEKVKDLLGLVEQMLVDPLIGSLLRAAEENEEKLRLVSSVHSRSTAVGGGLLRKSFKHRTDGTNRNE